MYSQTFKNKPTLEIVNKLVSCFGLPNLDSGDEFTLKKLEDNNTVDKYKLIEQELIPYYIPCKAKKYLGKYELKNIITVVRQFLKSQLYNFKTKEKFSNKKKFLIYQIVKINEEKKEEDNTNYVLTFN